MLETLEDHPVLNLLIDVLPSLETNSLQTEAFRSCCYRGLENAVINHVTGDGNCLFNSLSLQLSGTEQYAIELRVRTVLNLVYKPDSLSISIEEQLAECTSLDRSSVWYINAETCSHSLENIQSNVADLLTGVPVFGKVRDGAVRLIDPDCLKMRFIGCAKAMAKNGSWACRSALAAAASACD